MPDLNLTNMGSLSDNGTLVSNVVFGDDGTVYLAGCSSSGKGLDGYQNINPTVWCYRDGTLVWKKVFEGPYVWEMFKDLNVVDGYVYASGGIGYGFDPSLLPGAQWPDGKPTDEVNLGKVVGSEEAAGFFVKINAESGETIHAQIAPVSSSGSMIYTSNVVDNEGNVYLVIPGGSIDDSSQGGLYKYSSDGQLLWHSEQLVGDTIKIINGEIWALGGDYIRHIDKATGIQDTMFSPEGGFMFYAGGDASSRDFVIDENGDFIVVMVNCYENRNDQPPSLDSLNLGLTPTLNQIAAYAPLTNILIRKISSDFSGISLDENGGYVGTVVWEKSLNIQGFASTDFKGSILLTPEKDIMIAGSTIGSVEGATAFGTYDAFYTKLNGDGDILETRIIGTAAKAETASTAVYDANGNLYIAGEFNSKYFSLKDSGFQNIYLISDTGFTLMGDELDNIIQGGGGNDTISSGNGNDYLNGGLGNDSIDGGEGWDIANYEASTNAVTVNFLTKTASGLEVGNDTLNGIEEARGGAGSDILTASNAGNKLVGGSGNDRLNGGTGADVLYGGDGNDIVNAGNGNDEIVGGDGAGDDIYIGGAGIDTIKYSSAQAGITVNLSAANDQAKSTDLTNPNNDAGIGVDQLSGIENVIGGDYNDVITGSADANLLNGGQGADTLVGGAGNDTYIVDNVDDIVTENLNAGTDVVNTSVYFTLTSDIENLLYTGSSAWSGTGNALANVITGSSGADTLDGGTGIDKLIGGAGNDTYIADTTTDTITELANGGTDTIQSSVTFTLAALANVENLTLTGTSNINATGNASANTLTGNTANNTLDGGAGNDILNGDLGADTLIGGAGVDTLAGGAGNDTYVVDSITDTITEISGEGTDTVRSSVTFSLADLANVENLTYSGTAAWSGTGNSLNNVITGAAGADSLNGGDGNDTLNGAAGSDFLYGDAGSDVLNGGDGDDWLFAYSDYPDSQLSNAGFTAALLIEKNNSIDSLVGGKGNDFYVFDRYVNTPLITEIANEGTDTILGDLETYTLDSNVENYVNDLNLTNNGTPVTITIRGNASNNLIKTGPSSFANLNQILTTITPTSIQEAFYGEDGNDTLMGGAGNDTLDGGSGNDSLLGGDGNDYLDGGTGIDKLIGGTGNDTYIVDTTTDTITELANGGTDTIQSSVTFTLAALANVENLTLTSTSNINATGNAAANTLTGNTANNTLDGGAGNDILNGDLGADTLIGGAGVDTLIGGAGNDTYVVDSITDTITEISGEGTDTVRSSVTFSLASIANVENLTYTLNAAWTGTGNSLDNIITGSTGADTLNGGAGNDTLNGAAGNDFLYGDAGSDTLNGGDGDDWLFAYSDYSDSQLSNAGFTAALLIEKNNSIDSLVGGKGNDVYVFDRYVNTPVVIEISNEGTDTILGDLSTYTLDSNVENYVNDLNLTNNGTPVTITITGNNSNNLIKTGPSSWTNINQILTTISNSDAQEAFYGLGGNDTLMGGAGNDTLDGGSGNDSLLGGSGADYLDGGTGIDILIGGVGNDTYIVDTTTDTITELANGGTDTIQSSITFTLAALANVENLTLTGTSNINATGNTAANTLTGNSANNTLDGGAGNDILNGGQGADKLIGDLGNDTLTGGDGNDIFLFNKATGSTNLDTITDFTSGADVIQLSNKIFTKIGSPGTLSADAFWSGAGAVSGQDATDRIIYNTTTGALYYDADGNGSGLAVQITIVGSQPTIAYTDIAIVS